MTTEEHKRRHKLLHDHLLFADYISHHPDEHNFTEMPILKLIDWSHSQTLNPIDLPTLT